MDTLVVYCVTFDDSMMLPIAEHCGGNTVASLLQFSISYDIIGSKLSNGISQVNVMDWMLRDSTVRVAEKLATWLGTSTGSV